jgi:beta-N-acetylhexosaminidase
MRLPHAVIFLIVFSSIGIIPLLAQSSGTWTLDKDAEKWVETTLKTLSRDEKIGQLLIPVTTGQFTALDSDAFAKIKENIQKYHVGGYHVFGNELVSGALLINRIQDLAQVPLLITADFEGGVGYQFRDATRLPRAMAIGATGDPHFAYEAGKVAAEEGRALGVLVNFYPVVDVNNNPRNPIINIRSFGESVDAVEKMAAAYIQGTHEGGMMATAKHFPGHGDTSEDTHLMLPTLTIDKARLEKVELPPFEAAIRAGVDAVMSAHIYFPALEPEKGLPATLSKNILTGLLRNELKFSNLVFTDAMDMQGVTASFSREEATVRAVQAGVDFVIFSPDVGASFNALKKAVESGGIDEARIDQSVRRILRAKAAMGLHKNRYTDISRLDTAVSTKPHLKVARDIAENATTLIKDEKNVLPLQLKPSDRVLILNVYDSATGWREGKPGGLFVREFQSRHPGAVAIELSDLTTLPEFDLVRKVLPDFNIVLVNTFARVAAYRGSINLTENEIFFLKQLAKVNRPVVTTVFGNPYIPMSVPELPAFVLTFEIYPDAEVAAVEALTGEIPFRGKLPISLPGMFEMGWGIKK